MNKNCVKYCATYHKIIGIFIQEINPAGKFFIQSSTLEKEELVSSLHGYVQYVKTHMSQMSSQAVNKLSSIALLVSSCCRTSCCLTTCNKLTMLDRQASYKELFYHFVAVIINVRRLTKQN